MRAADREKVSVGRRTTLAALAAGVTGIASGRIHAAALLPTPAQTRGPFYPQELPLDSDNDLVRVSGRGTLARGEITDLAGRILDPRGRPVAGARVEIWQCDAYGRYHHPWDRRHVPVDENFQGYGRFVTNAEGAYRFRTIKPVPYPGRAPHIHFAVSAPGGETLVTQLYAAGAPENEGDFILNRIRDPKLKSSLIVPFTPAGGGVAEFEARFDIVLG